MTTTDRTAYTQGLRALADALDSDPDLPLPSPGSICHYPLSIFAETKAEVAAYARLMGKAEKSVSEDCNYGFALKGAFHGLHLTVFAQREEVCERIVTGARTVVTEVPDPEALALVPTITRTEVVETVTWKCSPLLAPVSA